MDPRSDKVSFPGSEGHVLAARFDRPAAAPIAYAIFAHCFTCSKDTRAATYVARALVAHGIAVLRFDFTGLGGSDGDFANSNFSSNVGDLVAAADWLRREHGAPQLLIGHSLGGAAVIAAASRVGDAVAVATINAPSDPAHVLHQLKGAAAEIEARGELEVQLAGRPFRIRKQFLDDVAAARLLPLLPQLGKALLVFHSPHDQTVDIEHASRLFVGARHPKSFVSLDDADHLLSRREDAEYVGHVLAAWVARYLRPARG